MIFFKFYKNNDVINMAIKYKCFSCNKNVAQDYIRKNVRCPYCGSKILYKPRSNSTKVKAR